MRFSFIRVSSNAKTGPIPVTMTAKESCPDNCSLKKNGCYAEVGKVVIHWRKLSDDSKGIAQSELMESIAKLPKGTLWRHNVSGDLKPDSINPDMIDSDFIREIIDSNKGKNGFTYTHHKVMGDSDASILNRVLIKQSNQQGFTINLSADSIKDADNLKTLNIGPVVTIMPEDCDKVTLTPAGNTVVQCPATYNDTIQCSNCGICQVSNRKAIIGFPVHGVAKKKAHKIFMLKQG